MFHIETIGTDVYVRVRGELDGIDVFELRKAIPTERPERGGGVNVDLTRCTYIDSSIISVLVMANRRLAPRFHVHIASTGLVHRILRICGLVRALACHVYVTSSPPF